MASPDLARVGLESGSASVWLTHAFISTLTISVTSTPTITEIGRSSGPPIAWLPSGTGTGPGPGIPIDYARRVGKPVESPSFLAPLSHHKSLRFSDLPRLLQTVVAIGTSAPMAADRCSAVTACLLTPSASVSVRPGADRRAKNPNPAAITKFRAIILSVA